MLAKKIVAVTLKKVPMAMQLQYLLRMGLCHDSHVAPVSVKNRKKKKIVSNINSTTTTMEYSLAPVDQTD